MRLGHETVVRDFAVDIRDINAVTHTFKAICKELGALDVFVHSAGDIQLGTIESSSIDEYWNSFKINVKGLLNCMQAFVRFGLSKDSAYPPATVINVSTIGIAMASVPSMSSCAASKLSSWKIMECLSVEMGDKLRVFSVHPGRIATDMAEKAGIPTADDKGILESSINCRTKPLLDEELPGGFCVWLAATPEADFLRGRLIACNWDADELLQMKDDIIRGNLLTISLSGWST